MDNESDDHTNNRSRVIAQIEHHETDPLPYVLTFEPGYDTEDALDAHFGSDQWRGLVDNAIQRYRFISDKIWTFDADVGEYWTDLFGTTWRMHPRPRQVFAPALEEPSLSGYRFPSIDDCLEPGWEARARAEIAACQGKFIATDAGFGLLGRTWNLRGFENALTDIVLQRDFFEEVIEHLTDLLLQIVERLARLPIDGVMFADDWGYQDGVLIGAQRWREIFKPRYARIFERVHAAGKYVLHHSCGAIAEILPDVIEIGLDVYESVQPEAKNNNPYELKRKFGRDITFWGGLGSQSTIPFGTPEDIRREVARLCAQMGRGGGYILAPAKPIQPGTPVENILTILEAFLEQAGATLPVITR
jgi:uroporphyrinogen decarboxylase